MENPNLRSDMTPRSNNVRHSRMWPNWGRTGLIFGTWGFSTKGNLVAAYIDSRTSRRLRPTERHEAERGPQARGKGHSGGNSLGTGNGVRVAEGRDAPLTKPLSSGLSLRSKAPPQLVTKYQTKFAAE
ncbi:hypothetical protein DdX_11576 [Ditylenchus destructor]|uniref:Uncharacterized protein n=1 Tax=Ditylenchus destructor TaxID=166010 RepID=A0AAD4MXR7_9BILA|nr:hypothetical protein DdX_11576 [Ditylenchus destructor]